MWMLAEGADARRQLARAAADRRVDHDRSILKAAHQGFDADHTPRLYNQDMPCALDNDPRDG
ncbi:MAG TPA: hypothetical protein VGE02_12565 [Gemmatimonadales bacterium]